MASAGASHCGFNSLNTNSPLQVQTLEGKNLSGVLQNHRQFFHISVKDELRLLSDDREEALARMTLSAGSDESLLHRFAAYFGFSFIFPPLPILLLSAFS